MGERIGRGPPTAVICETVSPGQPPTLRGCGQRSSFSAGQCPRAQAAGTPAAKNAAAPSTGATLVVYAALDMHFPLCPF